MSYLCVMTLWFCLADGSKLYKKHVSNSVLPSTSEPDYNISSWVRQLHLQQCVLVEIGEKYCGVYVEYRTLTLQLGADVQEYFLGLCDTETLHKWKFCSADLENERPQECIFDESTEYSDNPSRVHRRLCDITGLAFHGNLCNCSREFGGQKLHRVTGFPTCFLPSLPESLCEPRNVCGVASCNATTLSQQIHTVQCNPRCMGGQPFCELPGIATSQASKIDSFWSDWSEDVYDENQSTESNNFLYTEAICINKNTGLGAIDCLGPGTNCCPSNTEECKCYIYIEDGILKLFRKYKLKLLSSQEKNFEHYKSILKQREESNAGSLKRMRLMGGEYDQRKIEDEEYDDQDDDEEDIDNEDVILEENDGDTENRLSTTEEPEKDEIKNIMTEIVNKQTSFDDSENFESSESSVQFNKHVPLYKIVMYSFAIYYLYNT